MRILSFLFAFVALTALNFSHAVAQWTPLNGPGNSNVYGITSIDTILVAYAQSGFFRSMNYGYDWQPGASPTPGKWPNTLFTYGSILFAGGPNDISLSTDEGATWSTVLHQDSTRDFFAFTRTGTFLLCAANNGIYRSSDGGSHWGLLALSDSLKWVMCFASGTSGIAGRTTDVVIAGTAGLGLFKSIDHGDHWTKIGAELPTGRIRSIKAAAWRFGTRYTLTFLVGTSRFGIFSSGDEGATWHQLGTGLPTNRTVYCIESFGLTGADTVLAGMVVDKSPYAPPLGIWRLASPDTVWQQAPIVTGDGIGDLIDCGDRGILAATSYNGILRSPDRGMTWEWSSRGISSNTISVLAAQAGTIVAGTWSNSLFATQNDGTSWTMPFSAFVSTGDLFYAACAGDGHNFFVGKDGGGVLRSSDKGLSWQQNAPSPEAPTVLAMHHTASLVDHALYAGTYTHGIFRSTDEGVTFHRVNSGLSDSTVQALNSYTTRGPLPAGTVVTTLMAVTDKTLYLSTNGGTSWNKTNFVAEYPEAVEHGSSVILVGGRYGIQRSTDGGTSWYAANVGLTSAPVNCLLKIGTAVLAGTDSGAFVTKNDGLSWTQAYTGLGMGVQIKSIALDSGYVYAGTSSGVWKRTATEITASVVLPPFILPSEFSLGQNYPNPFNPSTVIRYSMPQKSWVRLGVYDLLGREITTLVNEVQDAGTREINFDGSSLASGVYFYRVQAAGLTISRKMLLLK